jgi:GntR family histidine utilization transcriptional repressor
VTATKSATLNQRIRSEIEERILSGEWPPGFRIPFEHELMEQYDCSRMTVNKVLTTLAENGMIERRRRAGSFVARRSPEQELVTLEIPDIALAMGGRQRRHEYELLHKVLREPDPAVYNETALAGGDKVMAIDGVHLADGRPVGVEHRLLNAASVPEVLNVDFSGTSPGTWLLQEVSWTRGEYRISAEGASEEDAQVLKCAPGQPCLVIERRTWRGESPITWARQIFLSSEHELVARFTAGGR